MLYILHGKDFKKSRANLKRLTTALLKKRPDSNLFKLDEETFSATGLEGFVGGQGLFEQKYLVVLDGCLANKDHKETILDSLKEIKGSENIFILIEEKIDAKSLKKLEKYSEKIQVFEKTETVKENMKLFTLTDAFAARDRKLSWVLYQKALNNGSSPEEIHSMLLWQVRSMVLTKQEKDANGAGLKPFVYSKSKRFLSGYSGDEIKKTYKKLVGIYHGARRGRYSLADSLEKTILEI